MIYKVVRRTRADISFAMIGIKTVYRGQIKINASFKLTSGVWNINKVHS